MNWIWMLKELNDDFGAGHTSLSNRYRVVDTEAYDLKPKREYIEKQIANLEEEIRRVQKVKEVALTRYEDEEKRLQGLIDEKRKALKKM